MFDVFFGPAREAQQRLTALGIDYVVFCPGAAERYSYAAAAPDGLTAALARGEVPDGLERIHLTGLRLRFTGLGIECGAQFRPKSG